MISMAALTLATLLVFATQSLSQTVNIFQEIPADVDQCIRPCLFRPNNPNNDLGDALNCGAPYKQQCYCATDSDRAKRASKHIDSCAQASCSSGHESQDAETMRHYYASYCMGIGYTADSMKGWYTGSDDIHATKTAKDMWGWSGTATRRQIFSDHPITAAPTKDGGNGDENGTLCSRSFQLPFMAVALLVALFQQT